MIKRKISIVGLGYVGSEIFKRFSKKEKNVFGYDLDPEKIAKLKKYQNLSNDINILSNSKYIFICIDTPVLKKKPDLSNILKFCKSTGKFNLRGAL